MICLLASTFHSTFEIYIMFDGIFIFHSHLTGIYVLWLGYTVVDLMSGKRAVNRTNGIGGAQVGSLVLFALFCITKWLLSRKCNIFSMIYDDYLSDTKAFTGNCRRERNEEWVKKTNDSYNANYNTVEKAESPGTTTYSHTHTHSHMLNRINSFCIIYIGIYGGKGL